jgi:proteasome lid subunit RPN8/RPN11
MAVKRIVVDAAEERKFRRRALRRMPSEYIETLFGIETRAEYVVCAFVEIEHIATPTSLDYDDEDLERHKLLAARSGLILLGSIHTHPHREDALFSDLDMRELLRLDEKVMGILAIDTSGARRRCTVAYWPQIQPLAVEYWE